MFLSKSLQSLYQKMGQKSVKSSVFSLLSRHYVEVICKIQTMYVTNLRSGLEYIVKEQNDLAKDYYKKIAQPVRV